MIEFFIDLSHRLGKDGKTYTYFPVRQAFKVTRNIDGLHRVHTNKSLWSFMPSYMIGSKRYCFFLSKILRLTAAQSYYGLTYQPWYVKSYIRLFNKEK